MAQLSRRLAVATVAIGMLVGSGEIARSAPALAFTGSPPLLCVATPTVHVAPGTPAGTFDWTITGAGSCFGNASRGTFTLSLDGSGTSTGLGLCSGLLVQNLALTVNVTITRISTGVTQTAVEHWFAPVTTYPLVTPFLVSDSTNKLVGAGAVSTHILLQCPPKGKDDGAALWLELD